jgi:hypothetical protein
MLAIKPTKPRAAWILRRPGRGPFDAQVDRALSVSQGGIMAFAFALH